MKPDLELTFEEKKYKIFNNGGSYFPNITYEDMQTTKLWANVLARLERYNRQIVFEYKEEMSFESFNYISMKTAFIQLGCIDKIDTSFIWRYNQELPIGTMFIYVNGSLKVMLETNK